MLSDLEKLRQRILFDLKVIEDSITLESAVERKVLNKILADIKMLEAE